MGLVDREFWRGKKVFLTGHTGFKGSWLTYWLSSMGAEVMGFALEPNTNPSLFNAIELGKHCHHVIGDIRDRKKLKSLLIEFQPEVVLHLAAQALVLESYDDPVGTFETNVIGTVNLLDSLREVKSVKTIINITTDKCYENKEWAWGYRETDPMGGYDPYSSSKGCSELATSAFRRSFFTAKDIENPVSLISCRAGNVFGGGDWCENRIIPDAIRAFSKGEPLQVRNPYSVRPWEHVLEPLRGYLVVAQRSYIFDSALPTSWNFGPADADALPVGELVDQMVRFWGEGASWEKVGNITQPHEAQYLKLDTSLARAKLNWVPLIALVKGLEFSVKWYKAFYQNNSPEQLKNIMKTQIEESGSCLLA